jgi:hypothetical protein
VRTWAATVALCFAVTVVGIGAATGPTSAAWTEDTFFSAQANAGLWGAEPITPGNADTVIDSIVWKNVTRTAACADVTIRGASPVPAYWQLDAHLNEPPFNGETADQIGVIWGVKGVATPDNVLPVTGTISTPNPFNPDYNNTPISDTQSAVIEFCVYYQPALPGDPSWYTYSQQNGIIEQLDPTDVTPTAQVQQCATLTVTAVIDYAAQPFFFGWQAPIDLSSILNGLESAGYTPTNVLITPDDVSEAPPILSPPQENYVITSGVNTSIRGNDGNDADNLYDQVKVRACVTAWSALVTPVTPTPTPSPSALPPVSPSPSPSTSPLPSPTP